MSEYLKRELILELHLLRQMIEVRNTLNGNVNREIAIVEWSILPYPQHLRLSD